MPDSILDHLSHVSDSVTNEYCHYELKNYLEI